MKFKNLVLLFIFFSVFFAREIKSDEISDSLHPYVKGGGTFVILPTAGIGLRYKNGNHGCDVSGSYAVLLDIKTLKILYLHHPFSNKHIYYGVGIGGGLAPRGEFQRHQDGWISFEQTIGYEWSSRDFFYFAQIELSESPMFKTKLRTWLPPPTITMGIGF